MCEIFAMSARLATNVQLSLSELARHGGATGPHRDGWGVVFHEARDACRFREAEAASDSLLVRMLAENDYRSHITMVHLRKSTQGVRALRNTQPFQRELGGRVHSFAHNGRLTGIEQRLSLGRFRRVGETDSEHAFCALMEAMRPLWERDDEVPSVATRHAIFAQFVRDIRDLGPTNIVYADGDALFVHAHERTQADGAIRPPGLHMLTRCCQQEGGHFPDSSAMHMGAQRADQQVVLFASVPLSDEDWKPLEPGTTLAAQAGQAVLGG